MEGMSEEKSGQEERKRQKHLLSLFAGEVGRIEGDDLDTLLPGAPQPAILLLCPSALRPPGAPAQEE